MSASIQLAEVRQMIGQLDPNDRNHMAQIQQLRQDEADLLKAVKQEEDERVIQKQIEAKKEELQEFVLGHDYSAALGHPKANAIIHTLLSDQAEEYEKRIGELARQLEAAQKQSFEVDGLTNQLQEAQEEKVRLIDENLSLRVENDELRTKLEDETKDSRYQRNEVTRITIRLQTVEQELDYLKKQKEQFKPNQKLDELLKEAQEFTNSKKQLKNIELVDKNTYKGVDAEGREVTFPWYAKNAYEEVETFPETNAQPVQESVQDNKPLDVTFQVEAPAVELPGVFEDAERGNSEESGSFVSPFYTGVQAAETFEEEMRRRMKKVEEILGVA